jgi:16S rRNA (adenine1518-N6/adenine1519-N6)-dimethyltransferase
MSSARQTQSFLIQRFQEAGIHPQTRHGQNFLIDLNLLDLLVRKANLGPADVVLEIGTGLGSLTGRMAQLAAAVITVEIDPHLYQLASEELGGLANVMMLQQDALKNKNTLSPAVLDAVRSQLAAPPGRYFKLVANLPYNVATPVLSNLLAADPVPLSMTVTIQKELADRIVAPPGTKDYSALSIWMQSLCAIEIVREMPPQVFWPRPKVTSAMIHIIPHPGKRAAIGDLDFFHNFIRALFLHRRKFLRGSLAAAWKDQIDKPSIDEILAPFQFPTDVRAEQLDVQTLLALSQAFQKRLDSTSPAR